MRGASPPSPASMPGLTGARALKRPQFARPDAFGQLTGALKSWQCMRSHSVQEKLAWRFVSTVYCKRSVAHVTPDQLLAGTREADLHTIARTMCPTTM